MTEPPVVDVGPVIDHQRFRPFTARVFALCFIAMLSEGYDLGVVGYAAPGMLHTFGVDRSHLAPVFSAALFGMLIGALVAGIAGDRFGRKKGIVVALAFTCVGSFGSAEANTLTQLLISRFVVGLGLGGVLPNVTALLAEYLPKRVRGTLSTYAFMGITTGGILPSLVSIFLARDEWRPLFLAGTAMPLICLPIIAAFLPESLKFLALHHRHENQLRKWLGKLDPTLVIPAGSRLVIDEKRIGATAAPRIFDGHLALVTPMLWICFVAIMMVNFFVNSWLTVLLRDAGFRHEEAAHAASLYYVGGVVGGLLIGFLLDRWGAATLSAVALLGAVSTYLLGAGSTSHAAIDAMVFLAGFTVLGGQVGMSSLAGMLYPTAIRSKGVGSAHSIGRLGAICGPLLGGALMAHNAAPGALFVVPATAMLIASISFAVITWRWTGRLLGLGFNKLDAAIDEPRPASVA